MRFSLLPQELVDLVIDYLWDDKEQLRSCALAARPFVYKSQYHLFDDVYLDGKSGEDGDMDIDRDTDVPSYPSYSETPTKFYELLTTSPHIIPLVKELCIGDSALHDEALPDVLHLLTKVNSLIIETPSTAGCGFRDWETLPSALLAAFCTLVERRALTHISLDTLANVPVSLFRFCPRLQRLAINEAMFDLDALADAISAGREFSSRAAPAEMDLDFSLQADFHEFMGQFAWPDSSLDVTSARNLEIRVASDQDSQTFLELQQLLDANRTSLCSFRFNPDHRDDKHILDLSNLHSLQTLTFDFSFNVRSTSDPIPWLARVLQTLPSDSNSLQEINILYLVQPWTRTECDRSTSAYERTSWEQLDTLVCGSKLQRLSKVTVDIDGLYVSDAELELHRNMVTASMPKALGKGLLSV